MFGELVVLSSFDDRKGGHVREGIDTQLRLDDGQFLKLVRFDARQKHRVFEFVFQLYHLRVSRRLLLLDLFIRGTLLISCISLINIDCVVISSRALFAVRRLGIGMSIENKFS